VQIGNDTTKKLIQLSSNQDTLRFSYLDTYGLFIEETYLKTSFDNSLLQILNQYTTNFPLLAGKWKLIREEGLEYGAYYELNFPYDIPDTLVLNVDELKATLHTDRSYQMMTNGKKKKYFLEYHNSTLWLRPSDWYQETDPSIHYERIEE
jgi:hypothetical protein